MLSPTDRQSGTPFNLFQRRLLWVACPFAGVLLQAVMFSG